MRAEHFMEEFCTFKYGLFPSPNRHSKNSEGLGRNKGGSLSHLEKKIKNKTKTKKILSHHITRLFELKMSLGNQTGPHGNWSEHNEKKRREEL